MMKRVVVNVGFIDVYTGENHKAGDILVMTEERIAEVREIDKNLISIVGNAPLEEESVEETEESVQKGKNTKKK